MRKSSENQPAQHQTHTQTKLAANEQTLWVQSVFAACFCCPQVAETELYLRTILLLPNPNYLPWMNSSLLKSLLLSPDWLTLSSESINQSIIPSSDSQRWSCSNPDTNKAIWAVPLNDSQKEPSNKLQSPLKSPNSHHYEPWVTSSPRRRLTQLLYPNERRQFPLLQRSGSSNTSRERSITLSHVRGGSTRTSGRRGADFIRTRFREQLQCRWIHLCVDEICWLGAVSRAQSIDSRAFCYKCNYPGFVSSNSPSVGHIMTWRGSLPPPVLLPINATPCLLWFGDTPSCC